MSTCSDREGFSCEETMSRLQNFQRDSTRTRAENVMGHSLHWAFSYETFEI